MSQLKVNGIRHTGASSDAVTLASDGTCTANITNRFNGNLIINGDMAIHQRTGTITSTGYLVDRWKINEDSDGAMTASQVVDAPAGFKFSTKIDITTADTSLASGQNLFLVQYLEGYNMSHLQWGTANAKTVTLSFWVKSTKTGTYSVVITNDSTNRTNAQDYTISSANTWEKKSLTYTGDTSTDASWATNHTIGMRIRFGLAAGSSLTTSTLGSWIGSDKVASTNCVNGLDSTSNDFYFTGVQLEVGDVATDFEHRLYGDELLRCKRYFNMHSNLGTNTALSDGFCWSANEVDFMYTFPVEMRTTPSIYQEPGADYFKIQGANQASYVDGNWTLQYASRFATSHYAGSDSSRTAGTAMHITFNNSAARLGYSAEF